MDLFPLMNSLRPECQTVVVNNQHVGGSWGFKFKLLFITKIDACKWNVEPEDGTSAWICPYSDGTAYKVNNALAYCEPKS